MKREEFDDLCRPLREELRRIQEDYQRLAQPVVEQLTRLHATYLPPIMLSMPTYIGGGRQPLPDLEAEGKSLRAVMARLAGAVRMYSESSDSDIREALEAAEAALKAYDGRATDGRPARD